MRLINADELEEILNEVYEENKSILRLLLITFAKQIIGDAPSIEAEPVRHGHWIKNERYSDEIEGHMVYECSECGELYYWFDVPEHKYCRHCGAKMEDI